MLIILEEGSPAVVTRIRRCGIDALEMCHAWLVRRFVRLIASLDLVVDARSRVPVQRRVLLLQQVPVLVETNTFNGTAISQR